MVEPCFLYSSCGYDIESGIIWVGQQAIYSILIMFSIATPFGIWLYTRKYKQQKGDSVE